MGKGRVICQMYLLYKTDHWGPFDIYGSLNECNSYGYYDALPPPNVLFHQFSTCPKVPFHVELFLCLELLNMAAYQVSPGELVKKQILRSYPRFTESASLKPEHRESTYLISFP